MSQSIIVQWEPCLIYKRLQLYLAFRNIEVEEQAKAMLYAEQLSPLLPRPAAPPASSLEFVAYCIIIETDLTHLFQPNFFIVQRK